MASERTFEEIRRVAAAYRERLLEIECGVLDGSACEALIDLVIGVERVEAAVKARLFRRATDANRWRTAGDRSADEWFARKTGTTIGGARAAMELADNLQAAPATEEALAGGHVSPDQAAEIAAATRVDPAAEGRLLRTATTRPLSELRRQARKVRAAASDETARRERIRRTRSFRHWTDPEGAFCFTGRGLPEDGAAILAALQPHQDAVFAAARQDGVRENSDAYAYDALVSLVTTRGDGGTEKAPAKIIATANLSALRRGHTEPGETCEIAGVGPVSVAAARDLLGDAFLAIVLSDGVEIRNVTHLGRAPTAHQRTALEAAGKVCAVPECGRTTNLEIDHVEDWALTRRTHIDHLDWLCAGPTGHHRQKTHGGYTLAGPRGNRTWHPPKGISGIGDTG